MAQNLHRLRWATGSSVLIGGLRGRGLSSEGISAARFAGNALASRVEVPMEIMSNFGILPSMPENIRSRMLEVAVVQRGRHSWEWRLHTGDEVHVCGFEATRDAARFVAYGMFFSMLAGGWM
jgi:hypothetical protein